MIIAERSYCDSSHHWLQQITDLLEIISTLPDVVLQIRNKSSKQDWQSTQSEMIGILNQYSDRIVLNGTIFPQYTISRHLPESLLPSKADSPLLGASVHSNTALKLAQSTGVDYIQVGAVYATAKPVSPLGIGELKIFCQNSTLPVLAVGGINTPERVIHCINAGSWGISIGRWILNSSDPKNLIASILSLIHDHTQTVR